MDSPLSTHHPRSQVLHKFIVVHVSQRDLRRELTKTIVDALFDHRFGARTDEPLQQLSCVAAKRVLNSYELEAFCAGAFRAHLNELSLVSVLQL